MSMRTTVEQARRVATHDPEAAEALLTAAAPQISEEPDREVVLAFAAACHDWGRPEDEEAALRLALARQRSPDVAQRLLDVLLQVEAPSDALIAERERLTTEILAGADGSDLDEDTALTLQIRGEQRVRQARRAKGDRMRALAAEGLADLDRYRAWLLAGRGVPANWPIPSHLARLDADRALAIWLLGGDAVPLLEGAIAALEATAAPRFMVDPMYELLATMAG